MRERDKGLYIYWFIIVLFSFMPLNNCKNTILTAPDGSVLIISANPTIILSGESSIIRVIGNRATGTPLPDGTLVYFTSSMGTIDSSKELVNGLAEVLFKTNETTSGNAEIFVCSGNATVKPEKLVIEVLTTTSPELSTLRIVANPVSLPPEGGKTNITVFAFDKDSQPLEDIGVILKSDTGWFAKGGSVLYTNQYGKVKDVFNTTETAQVTAYSGDISDSITITVGDNELPVASFVFSPEDPKENDTVYFNAGASYDPDGTIVEYRWDFGDGNTASGMEVTHVYTMAATYNVLLVVIDNDGGQVDISKSVTVIQ